MKRKRYYENPVIDIEQMFWGVDALMSSGISGSDAFSLDGYDDSDFI